MSPTVVVICVLRYGQLLEQSQRSWINTTALVTGCTNAAGLVMVGNFQVGKGQGEWGRVWPKGWLECGACNTLLHGLEGGGGGKGLPSCAHGVRGATEHEGSQGCWWRGGHDGQGQLWGGLGVARLGGHLQGETYQVLGWGGAPDWVEVGGMKFQAKGVLTCTCQQVEGIKCSNERVPAWVQVGGTTCQAWVPG